MSLVNEFPWGAVVGAAASIWEFIDGTRHAIAWLLPGDLAELLSILGFSGVIFAVLDAKGRAKDARRHTLVALRESLKNISQWSRFDEGGYDRRSLSATVKSNKTEWRNTFWQTFEIDASAIQSLWLTPGVPLLGPVIVERFAGFSQEVANFNSQVRAIDRFTAGIDAAERISIHLKLHGVVKDPLTEYQEFVCTKLEEMYALLYFEHVGNASTNTLYQRHVELMDAVESELSTLG